MKKIKLFALAVMAMLGTNAMADDFADGYLRYSTSGTTATITGFVASNEVADVVIPAQVTDPVTTSKKYDVVAVGENAFKGKTIIASVTIADTKVTELKDGAFENCTNLTTVTIGKAVEKIGVSFKGCSKLATVKFNAADKAQTIAASAFEGTAIETLDLTNTKVATLERLFTSGTTKNKKLETIKLPLSLTTINASAFENCLMLANIEFASGTGAKDVTIKASAFANTIFLEDLELPARVAVLEANALKDSEIKTLTINSHATANAINAIGGASLESIIVKGAFKGAFGDGSNAVSTTVKSVTFEGTVENASAIAAKAFVGATNLATVEFKGTIKTAKAIATGAFDNTTGSAVKGGLVVIYQPEQADPAKVAAFAVDAFAAAADVPFVTLKTNTWYNEWIKAQTTVYPLDGTYNTYINCVMIQAAAVTKTLKVANNGEGKYFYASFLSDGNYKIAAEQNGAKVMVYGAYMDQVIAEDGSVTNTAYMAQGKINGGYYYITNGEKVVVKSTTDADVTLIANDFTVWSSYAANDIIATTEELLGQELMNACKTGQPDPLYRTSSGKYETDQDVYFLAPFAEYGLLWSKFKATRTLPKGTFYLTVPKAAAAARLNIVWLDGSEEDQTTAIQAVKQVVEDDAIYNLAGQKVSASYKGVVIKNGKKMIQK